MNGVLSEMVRAANEGGMPLDRLAERGGTDPEGKRNVSRSYLVKLARGDVNNAPRPNVVQGLAQALGKPLVVIQAAAAEQFLGLKPPMPGGLSDDANLVTRVVLSSDGKLRSLRRLIEALNDDRGE